MTAPENQEIAGRERSRFFLVRVKGTAKRRLCYGVTLAEARETLSYRLTPAEMRRLDWSDVETLKHQREIPLRKGELA